jgi:hypothetical protein
MVQYFIEHENEIIAFLNKTNNKHNKTRKHIRH